MAMKDFEKEEFRLYISEEFGKVDAFYAHVKNDFGMTLMKIIEDKSEAQENKAQLSEAISVYAQEIINVTESVIDKDRNYSEIRLKEELQRVQKVVSQWAVYEVDTEFVNKLHQVSKEVMAKYFKPIFDLSADGFRLLDNGAKMHTLRFLASYRNIVLGTFPV
jgi:hypothetical protein